jgi:hypothetical protein
MYRVHLFGDLTHSCRTFPRRQRTSKLLLHRLRARRPHRSALARASVPAGRPLPPAPLSTSRPRPSAHPPCTQPALPAASRLRPLRRLRKPPRPCSSLQSPAAHTSLPLLRMPRQATNLHQHPPLLLAIKLTQPTGRLPRLLLQHGIRSRAVWWPARGKMSTTISVSTRSTHSSPPMWTLTMCWTQSMQTLKKTVCVCVCVHVCVSSGGNLRGERLV